MKHFPSRALISVAIASCIAVALLRAGPNSDVWRESLYVLLIGTVYGQSIFAAIWSALGPGPLAKRMTASLLWMSGLVLALYFNLRQVTGWYFEIPMYFGLALLTYWLVAHALLMTFAQVVGLKITKTDAEEISANRATHQFTIGQILFFVTTVGLFLGGARMSLSNMPPLAFEQFLRWDFSIAIWIFLAALFLFPALYLATLSSKSPGRFIVAAILFMAAEGMLEVYLAWDQTSFHSRLDELLNIFLYVFCGHVVATSWLAIFGLSLRTAGYRVRVRYLGSGIQLAQSAQA